MEWKNPLLIMAAGITGAILACSVDNLQAGPGDEQPLAPATGQMDTPTHYSPTASFAPLVEALQPAVVNVFVSESVEMPSMGMNGMPDEIFKHFFGPFGMPDQPQERGGANPWNVPETYERQGQGSGFIISADGYILTNNHVVENADEVKVKLTDDRELQATVVGTDDRTDVALIKVESDDPLPFVKLGVSSDLRVGDWVVAIGNPFGLSHTVTAGIVSAKGRIIGAGPYDDFIQTDASINLGNSGGPLFDTSGEVVGINTAIVAAGHGIAFAVPIDMVTGMLDELKSTGRVARGWIGVALQPLDEDLAAALGADATTGAIVGEVYPDTPGAKAGLQRGDVVVAVDGVAVEDTDSLVRTVGNHKPGDTLKLSVIRDGKNKSIKVTLSERPSEDNLSQGRFRVHDEDEAAGGDNTAQTTLEALGLHLESAPVTTARKNRLPSEVVVASVKDGSPADGKLRRGDFILEVNRTPISSLDDVNRALKHAGDVVLFLVENDGVQRFVAVRGSD